MPRCSPLRRPVRAVLVQQSSLGGRRASSQQLTAQTALAEVLREIPQEQSQRQGCRLRSVWGHVGKGRRGRGPACGGEPVGPVGLGTARHRRPAPGEGAKPEPARTYLRLAG